MELYTSLVQLKQAMNGGTMPPMTAIPEDVARVIDPAYTIGMGALSEDADQGLRCPVRGCGVYRHLLKRHIDTEHDAVGGAAGIRRLLSIPLTAPLVSHSYQRRLIANYSKNPAVSAAQSPEDLVKRQEAGQRASRAKPRQPLPIGVRNLRNTCQAQLSHRIIDLTNRLGRSPSYGEFENAYPGLIGSVKRVFGSWVNAKESCGLDAHRADKNGKGVEARRMRVLEALRTWYDIHGDLPTFEQARNVTRAPALVQFRLKYIFPSNPPRLLCIYAEAS